MVLRNCKHFRRKYSVVTLRLKKTENLKTYWGSTCLHLKRMRRWWVEACAKEQGLIGRSISKNNLQSPNTSFGVKKEAKHEQSCDYLPKGLFEFETPSDFAKSLNFSSESSFSFHFPRELEEMLAGRATLIVALATFEYSYQVLQSLSYINKLVVEMNTCFCTPKMHTSTKYEHE